MNLPPELDGERRLTEREVHLLTGRSLQRLRNERCRRVGIPYIKDGRSVRYRLGDVLDHLAAQTRIETEAAEASR
jgi:hypothetical protein